MGEYNFPSENKEHTVIVQEIPRFLSMLIFTLLADFIGLTAFYNWLKYNYGKEIITLNNKSKTLTYKQVVFGYGRGPVIPYSSIISVIGESEAGRNPDYHCCLINNEEKFRFGAVNGIQEGKNLAIKINDFIIK